MEEKLIPLANVARDLSDDDLQECVMFAAYLAYRRRVFGLSSKMFSRPTQLAPDAATPTHACDFSNSLHCPACGKSQF